MKSNGLLKWLVLPLLALAVFVGVRLFSSSGDINAASKEITPANTLTPAELKALGAAGDTPKDTMATLVGQIKELRKELENTVKENKQQKTENERLRQSERTIDQRIQNALLAEREKTSDERRHTQTLLQELRQKLERPNPKAAADTGDLPVGLGLRDDEGNTDGGPVRWVEPADQSSPSEGRGNPSRRSGSNKESGFKSSFTSAADHIEQAFDDATDAAGSVGLKPVSLLTARPVYTVPANATLAGSVAMTALIGRIPIDGTVHDAFPFKVLIGADNLTANGIEIPEVAGAVVSGTASGDWTLSCVRGQIRSITFVFADGTVRTVSAQSAAGKSGRTNDDGLGWISDPYGVPCVSGERRSNAQQYLSSQALITAAGAGAAAFIKPGKGNASFATGANGNVVGTVGISGNEAMGRILAGGVQDLSEWVNKLYGQAFAAIYVRPGAAVAVHIEQPLNIDYESHGRKVNEHAGEPHDSDLE